MIPFYHRYWIDIGVGVAMCLVFLLCLEKFKIGQHCNRSMTNFLIQLGIFWIFLTPISTHSLTPTVIINNSSCNIFQRIFEILYWNNVSATTQPAFTCSKLTIETPEQGLKYVQNYQKGHQNDAIGIVLVSLLLTFNIFQTLF